MLLSKTLHSLSTSFHNWGPVMGHLGLQDFTSTLQGVKVIDLMLIHLMDCDEGPGAHLFCQQGEPKGTREDSWKALESLLNKGKLVYFLSHHVTV